MMSLREVFQAAQSGKEQKVGGSVLRQASRRLADSNKPNSQRDSTLSNGNENQAPASASSASMSRLTASMKPPSSSSHEPSPSGQPLAASANHSTSGGPATYTVSPTLSTQFQYHTPHLVTGHYHSGLFLPFRTPITQSAQMRTCSKKFKRKSNVSKSLSKDTKNESKHSRTNLPNTISITTTKTSRLRSTDRLNDQTNERQIAFLKPTTHQKTNLFA